MKPGFSESKSNHQAQQNAPFVSAGRQTGSGIGAWIFKQHKKQVMSKAKKFKEFIKQKEAWYKSVCEMADEIFPPGRGCRNYLDHDNGIVTVTNSGWAHYLSFKVGCFIAPPAPIWID